MNCHAGALRWVWGVKVVRMPPCQVVSCCLRFTLLYHRYDPSDPTEAKLNESYGNLTGAIVSIVMPCLFIIAITGYLVRRYRKRGGFW